MNAMIPTLLTKTVEGDRRISDDSLLALHDRYFSTVPANSPALVEVAHALRFQVYCLERQFENAEEHPDGLEIDAYDNHAVQGVLFHRPTRSAMGAVRVILTQSGMPDSLPIEKLIRPSCLSLADYVDLSQTIEISRFAISKEFRRRKCDEADASAITRAETVRETNLAFLSLLQFVLRECVNRNKLFWTAVMEPRFLRLLGRMGISYTSLGPLVIHHGIRQPCYCYLPEMLEKARLAQPQCWEVLTDGGILHDMLLASARERAYV